MAGTITRGKVIRADLANWDGKAATYTRVDATGGTITGVVVGNEVDVLQVFGSGTDRTGATIRSALNHINTSNVTLVFAPGTWTVSSNLTIGANFTCHIPAGCVFSVDTGVTLTFSGDVHVEDPEAWYTGSGTVIVSREGAHGAVWHRTAAERSASVTPASFSYPPGDIRRYGGDPTGSAASTAAFEAAQDAHPECIYFPEGTFKIDGPQALVSNTRITCTPDTIVRVPTGGMSTDIGWMRMVDVSNVVIEGNNSLWDFETKPSANENRHIFDLRGAANIKISDVRCAKAGGDAVYIGSGIITSYCEDIELNNVQADNCRRQGISIVSVIGLRVNGGKAENITGTSPAAGIDIEPNDNQDELQGIRIVGFRSANCDGAGIATNINDLPTDYELDITIEDHFDDGSLYGFLCQRGTQMLGRVVNRSPVYINNGDTGVAIRSWAANSSHVEIVSPTVVNPNVDNISAASYAGHGISVFNPGSDSTLEMGNVTIVRPVLTDNRGGSALMKDGIFGRNLEALGELHKVRVIDPIAITGNTAFKIGLRTPEDCYLSDPLEIARLDATSNQTIGTGGTYSTVTNSGASGTVTITLDDDTPPNDIPITFRVEAAQEFRIDPQALSTIRYCGATAAQYVFSNALGSAITLKRTSTTTWDVVGITGEWHVQGAAAYTVTNVTTDRTYDANATTTDELADVLGTLIADLVTKGILP